MMEKEGQGVEGEKEDWTRENEESKGKGSEER